MQHARPADCPAFQQSLVRATPELRRFALSLTRDPDMADDLVQETLARALENSGSFTLGTNLPAWLITILKNQFLTELRKRRRRVDDPDGAYEDSLTCPPEQEIHAQFRRVNELIGSLPHSMREALIAIGAAEYSYEEAAEMQGCAIGTIKSRTSRARAILARQLGLTPHSWDIDPVIAAALSSPLTRRATL